ncbi:tetratricopeptide repeat protein [Hymenobacter sp. UYCo722]|uniref:tetratricopeptide repeat protein n=1 Tax=Hymenobacter sp. UYCo722 TaxID=3156335 RepID=UPI003398A799
MKIIPFIRRQWMLLLGTLVGLGVLWQLKLPAQVGHTVSFARGVAAYRASAYDDAEIFFRQLPIAPAQAGPVQYNLGNALYQQGRYPEARACYLTATHAADSLVRARAWANLGQLYYRTQRLPDAYAAYRSALLLAPDDEAIRQDFLFVRRHFLARTKRPAPASAADKAQQPPKGAGAPSPKGPQPGPPPKPSAQLSNRDIQDIMGLIDENENRVREKMSDSRQRGRKPESDEQDY